jgi:hypothetical protein
VPSGVAILATTTWAAFQAKKQPGDRVDETGASKDSWKGAVTDAKKIA